MAKEIFGSLIPGPNLALKVHGESRVGCSLKQFRQLSLKHFSHRDDRLVERDKTPIDGVPRHLSGFRWRKQYPFTTEKDRACAEWAA